MPRFEFSWQNEDGTTGSFRTCCPNIAEVMMRSEAGFPKLPPAIRQQFFEVYGAQRGLFERLLRSGKIKITGKGFLDLGIDGLNVQTRKDAAGVGRINAI